MWSVKLKSQIYAKNEPQHKFIQHHMAFHSPLLFFVKTSVCQVGLNLITSSSKRKELIKSDSESADTQ